MKKVMSVLFSLVAVLALACVASASESGCGMKAARSRGGADLVIAGNVTFRFQGAGVNAVEEEERGPLGVNVEGVFQDRDFSYARGGLVGVVAASARLGDRELAFAVRRSDGNSVVVSMVPGAESVAFLDKANKIVSCRGASQADLKLLKSELSRLGRNAEVVVAQVPDADEFFSQIGL